MKYPMCGTHVALTKAAWKRIDQLRPILRTQMEEEIRRSYPDAFGFEEEDYHKCHSPHVFPDPETGESIEIQEGEEHVHIYTYASCGEVDA